MSGETRKKVPLSAAADAVPDRKRDNGNVRWFNPQPTLDDLRELDSDSHDQLGSLADLFNELPPEDRITTKYDLRSTRFLAIYFRSPDDPVMPVDALSVRGATAFDACVLLAFFHIVKYGGEWGGGEPEHTGRFG